MSLFGDIGNIFHSIGHFFNNGNDQQGNTPTVVRPSLPWQQQPSNNNSTQWQPPMQAPQKQVQQQHPQPQHQQQQVQVQPVAPNHINLFQGGQHMPQTGSFDPNAPLVKTQPAAHPAAAPPVVTQANEPTFAPTDGDIPGLTKALHFIGNYNPDDQTRILNRASRAGIVPHNMAAADILNINTPNTPYQAPSKASAMAQAVENVSGVGALARELGDNLGARTLYNNKQVSQPDATNIMAGEYNKTGLNFNDPNLAHAAETIAGQGITAATMLGGPTAGAGIVKGADALSTAQKLAKASKVGAGLSAVQGVNTSLSENNISPMNLIKNTAKAAPLAFAAPVLGATTEVAAGVHSINPTQAEDAAAQVAQKEAQATSDLVEPTNIAAPETNPQPAYQRGFGTETPTQVRDFQLRQRYGQLIKDHPDQAPQLRAHLQQLLDTPLPKETSGELSPAEAMPGPGAAPATASPETSAPPATESSPVPQPTPVAPATPVSAPISPVQENPGVPAESPVQSTGTQESSSSPNNVSQTPNNVNGRTAENAPNVRDQIGKQLQDLGAKEDAQNPDRNWLDKVTGKTREHDVFSNDELNQAADRYNATKSDEELLKDYTPDENKSVSINNSADLARAYSAIKRLGPMAAKGNENAAKAIDDILSAAELHVSSSGRTLNYAGSMYDSLPKEAKTAYLLKNVDKARADAKLPPLTDAERAAATDTINSLLDKGEAYMQVAVEAQGRIEAIQSAAKAHDGSLPADYKKQLDHYSKVADDNIRQAHAAQGELTTAYSKLAPEGTNIGNIGNKAGNFARSLMLTSMTGRASDVATTSMNVLHSLTQSSIESAMGKIANTKRAILSQTPGKYEDTMPSLKAFGQGGEQGLKKAGGEFAGKSYVDDVHKAIKSNGELGKGQLTRTDNSGVVGFIKSRSHALAETATNLSQGMKNTKMLQMAYRDGKQAGLTGDDLDAYAHATAALPSKAMAAKGDQLVAEVNNMNDNPFTHGLETIAKGFDKIPVVGDSIRNLVSPFNRWVGGAAWNGMTDKNVVANVIKMGRAMAKGDSQEAMHQAAGFATNSVAAMGAGYALAQAGVLRTTNAEGYNDDGLYLHLGNHNIPVGFFGFFAPGIIMGAATHDAMSDNTPNKSMTQKVMDAATKSFDAMATAYLHNTTIGGGNSLLRDTQNAIQHKAGTTWGDVAVNAAGDAAGNYIPGAAGDVNSAINTYNIGNLNPTHEAGLTKVTKGMTGHVDPKTGNPSTAKDVFHTDMNILANRVPVLGQKTVPRNPGVAAQDPLSRIVRGDNESPEQQATKNAIAALPQDQQNTVMNTLHKSNPTAQFEAQKAADAMAPGPSKTNAQQIADKMAFAGKSDQVQQAISDTNQANQKANFQTSGKDAQIQTIGDKTYAMINGKAASFDNPQKAQEAVDKAKFVNSKQDVQTINGKTWANIGGSPKAFDTPIAAKQAVDYEKFKASGKQSQEIDGMHFEKGSDGKPVQMEQKDYDYKMANDQITSAKNSGDVTGYLKGHQDLLDNIGWQLNHADLTDQNRQQLTQKAVQLQEEYAKTIHDGGFSTPKGVPAYATPTITGAKTYTPDEQKSNGGYKDYTQVIQEKGAKYGLDINALMSVAAQEGLNGGVGDGGHAFGPFQMNDAGGVLTGKFSSPAEARAYAESPQGIEDAIKQIAAVAKGKTGQAAIEAIVNGFERPADPAKEIANALALYNGGKATLSPAGNGSTGVSSLTPSDSSSSSAASEAARIRENKIGSLPALARESFIENGMTARPVTPNIPQIKLTDPETLIKAHKITVGMPKA